MAVALAFLAPSGLPLPAFKITLTPAKIKRTRKIRPVKTKTLGIRILITEESEVKTSETPRFPKRKVLPMSIGVGVWAKTELVKSKKNITENEYVIILDILFFITACKFTV